MDLTEALLDSWDRQCRIVDAVAAKVDESNRHLKPSEDGWPLDHQLAHIHMVRKEWMYQLDKDKAETLANTLTNNWSTPIPDLAQIKSELEKSGKAVGEVVKQSLATNGLNKAGGYDNPVLYLQHMVWHEGWHIGLIFLALRLANQEPTDEWSEAHVWGEWRTEEWP